MMSNIKNIIIVVVVVVVVLLGYLLFFNKNSDDTANLDSSLGTDMPADIATDVTGGTGSDFIATLLNIKNITLDISLLSDPAFATLRDSSIELIPDGTEGRPNPFAPIGIDVGAVAAPAVVSTQVLPLPSVPTTTPTTTVPKTTTPVKPAN